MQGALTQRLAALFARRPLPGFAPRVARGVNDPHNRANRRIVVTVDRATFEAIGRAAKVSDVTVSEAIRQLIARGLAASPRKGG